MLPLPLFCEIPYWYVAWTIWVTMRTWLSEFCCSSTIMGAWFSTQNAPETCVSRAPPGPAVGAQHSPDPLAGFGEETPGQGRNTKGKEGNKGTKGGWGEGKRTKFIPALLFPTSSPGHEAKVKESYFQLWVYTGCARKTDCFFKDCNSRICWHIKAFNMSNCSVLHLE